MSSHGIREIEKREQIQVSPLQAKEICRSLAEIEETKSKFGIKDSKLLLT